METIENPNIWELVMELEPLQLTVVAFSHQLEQSLKLRHIPIDSNSANRLHSLEDAIYDNPLLLNDFKHTTILIASRRFALLPPLLPDSKGTFSAEQMQLARMAIDTTFAPDSTDNELILNSLSPMQATIAFEADRDIVRFLRRTFHGATIAHSLTPLCRYFQAKHSGKARGKMMANLSADRTDVILLGEEAPLLVNSYPTREPMDAFYYIMAARANAKAGDTDEIILAGDRHIRAAIAPLLRRYVRYVMPALFPAAMFRAGKNSLSAPFETIIAPSTL